MMGKKPGLDLMMAAGRPKPPRPPGGMEAPAPPDDMQPDEEEGEDTSRLGKIENMLEKICEALGIDMAQYDQTAPADMPAEEGAEAA